MSTGTNKKIKQVKEYEGMLTCIFEHEVVKSTAEYEWTGPKLSREVWNEVLAFFRWTQATTKSESQVRLYCNHLTYEWKAWAFPQTEGTGMTTREIENEDAKTQRAQFSDGRGWFYYGTVHHHCTGSAFQSSVDEANERNQDGIHITVGKLESPQYDIDARLYQSGYKIMDWEIEEFWETGDVYAGIPTHIKEFLPKDYPQRMALLQMGTPPPNDQTFPEVWRTNLIREVRVTPRAMTYDHSPGYWQNGGYVNKKSYTDRSHIDTEFDRKRFVSEVIRYLTTDENPMKPSLDEFAKIISDFSQAMSFIHCDVLDIMLRNDVRFPTAIKLMEEIKNKTTEMQLEKELEAKLGKTKGRPQSRLGLPAGGNGASTEKHAGAVEHMENEGGHYAGYGHGFGMGG